MDQILVRISDAYRVGAKSSTMKKKKKQLPGSFDEIEAHTDKLAEFEDCNRNEYLIEMAQLLRRVQAILRSSFDTGQALATMSRMLGVMLSAATQIRLKDLDQKIREEKRKHNPLRWLDVTDLLSSYGLKLLGSSHVGGSSTQAMRKS